MNKIKGFFESRDYFILTYVWKTNKSCNFLCVNCLWHDWCNFIIKRSALCANLPSWVLDQMIPRWDTSSPLHNAGANMLSTHLRTKGIGPLVDRLLALYKDPDHILSNMRLQVERLCQLSWSVFINYMKFMKNNLGKMFSRNYYSTKYLFWFLRPYLFNLC